MGRMAFKPAVAIPEGIDKRIKQTCTNPEADPGSQN